MSSFTRRLQIGAMKRMGYARRKFTTTIVANKPVHRRTPRGGMILNPLGVGTGLYRWPSSIEQLRMNTGV